MKIGIIGTGAVGSACALAAAIRGSAREIVLVNRTRKTAEAVAIFQTALDGFAMTVKKLSDVYDAAVPKLAGLRRGIETTLAFIEG